MDTQDFLSHVLPAAGYRFATLIFPDGKVAQKKFFAGSEDELIGYCTWGESKGADAYFAVGAYASDDDVEVRRTAEHSRLHRCLRVDVDCGAGKPYPDKGAALAALLSASRALQLPDPTLVDSGYGLHAYWAFDRDLDTVRWRRLSLRLASALHASGLQVDPTVTAEAARVLRLPGTSNFKRSACAPVRLLRAAPQASLLAVARALAPFPEAGSSARAGAGVPETALNAELMGSMEHAPYRMRGVFRDCPGFAAMGVTRGAGIGEPLWKAALDLVAASGETLDGRERLARFISDGHAGFDEDAFQRKWAQTLAQNYQPATCTKFEQLGMPQCAQCPLRGRIGSPVQLGREQPAVIAQPLPPVVVDGAVITSGPLQMRAGESRATVIDGRTATFDIRGGIPHVRRKDGEDADKKPIFKLIPIGDYPILAIELVEHRHGAVPMSYALVTFDRYKDGPVTVEFGPAEQSESRACGRALAANNIRMKADHVNIFRDTVMVEFCSLLQRLQRSGQIAARCGWTPDYAAFVLGSSLYRAGAAPEAIRPTGVVEAMAPYKSAGDEAAWLRGFRTALAGGPERQAVIALSLGAPLFAFAGVEGAMLNAFSPESGVGKSTVCEAALSIWGNPAELRKDAKDTANATFKLAAATGNLPYVVDEFTNIEGKELSNFVYTMTQGRERHRMGSDARLITNMNRWCLPLIVTSNNSVHDKLQKFRADAEAESARVFELRFAPLSMSQAELAAAKSDLALLRSHFGFMGPRIAQLLVARPSDSWRSAVARCIAQWDSKMNAGSVDRFRSALCATAEMGARLGRILGLPFDVDQVVRCLEDAWVTQARRLRDNTLSPEDILRQFVDENQYAFAVLGNVSGRDLLRPPAQTSKGYIGEIRSRPSGSKYEVEGVLIKRAVLVDYFREKNYNWVAFEGWVTQATAQGDIAPGDRHPARASALSGATDTRVRGYLFKGSLVTGIRPLVVVKPVAATSTETA